MFRKVTLSLVVFFLCVSITGANAAPSKVNLSSAISITSPILPISIRDGEEYEPAIAYNSLHGEYLVVWQYNAPGGYTDVYAQRITQNGRLLSWFAVSSAPNKKANPAVAYDPIHDRYLVVFGYDTSGNDTNWDIYGKYTNWNGPGLDPDFAICDWTSSQTHPRLAFAYAQNEYLVTWVNHPSGQPTYISARRVNAAVTAGPSILPWGPFLISSGTQPLNFPDVAYNLARNEYLVVWDLEWNANNLDIYGVRLNAVGSQLTHGTPPVSGEFSIAGWPSYEEKPSVAACHLSDQYFVAWQSDDGTAFADFAVYGYFISGEAVLQSIIQVIDTTSHNKEPAIACNHTGNRYLVTWQDKYVGGEYGIWARFLFPDQSMSNDFEVLGPRYLADRQMPAVAGGKTNMLIAWEHDRDLGTNLDIYGRLIGNFIHLPVIRK